MKLKSVIKQNVPAAVSLYHLLTTTFTGRTANEEILTGEWCPINLEKAPFCLPAPLTLVDEACTGYGGRNTGKSLGLWRIADLPV